MKILLVTHHYPPVNKPGSARPHAWARYWKSFGHDVLVITTIKGRHDGSLDYILPDNLKVKQKITEIGYWPYSMSRKNYDQETSYFIGVSNTLDVQTSLSKIKNKFFKKLTRIRRSIILLPYLKLWWIKPAVKYSNELYKIWPYDVVVSTFSPFASHIIGSKLKKKRKIFWVADYRDLLTGDTNSAPYWPISLLVKVSEKYFLKRADLITTVSDSLRDELINLHRKPVITIEHGFDPDETPTTSEKYFPRDNKIRLVHTGSLFADKRDPSPLFDAIKKLEKYQSAAIKRLEVLFFGPKSKYLHRLIERYDVSNYVIDKGHINRQSSIKVQREADALLFFEWNVPSVKGLLSSKIFEYLYSGTPILSIGAAVSNSGNKIIEESGTGIILNRSIKDIEAILIKLLKGQEIAYNPNSSCLEKYHKRELAKKMINEIHDRTQF